MRKRTTTAIVAFALILQSGWASPTMAQRSKSSQSPEYELALQRGTQAVIWGMSAVSMKGLFKSIQRDLGAGYQDIVYFSGSPPI